MAGMASPFPHLARPVNDGTWTTPYADYLDAIGLREEARAERAYAIGMAKSPKMPPVSPHMPKPMPHPTPGPGCFPVVEREGT